MTATYLRQALERLLDEHVVRQRIRLLLGAPDGRLDYAGVSELAHAVDDIVVSEIENWQAVFGGKHVTVPVQSDEDAPSPGCMPSLWATTPTARTKHENLFFML